MNKSVVKHKRGDTFIANVTYRNAVTQVGIDISTIDIKSQVRTSTGELVSDLILTKTDSPSGKFTLADLDTQDWPFNQNLIWDIQYTANGDKISSETIEIYVLFDVTE